MDKEKAWVGAKTVWKGTICPEISYSSVPGRKWWWKGPAGMQLEKMVETKPFVCVGYCGLERTGGSLVVQRYEDMYFTTYRNGAELSNVDSALYLSGKVTKVPQH